MPETQIEQVAYAGWPNCYRVTNGEVELIVTTDVGPRVIRFGFTGGQNLFAEIEHELGKSGEKRWMVRGGHRFWVAPELVPDTYALDNGPVKAIIRDGQITLVQPVELETLLRKEISIEFSAEGEVTLTHRLENTGSKCRRLAPWAVTQLAPGGVGITGFPLRGSNEGNLLPTNPLVMWAYTDFSDKRWIFTNKYLLLKQDPANHRPQKMGLFNRHTFGAYLLGTQLFIKCSEAIPHVTYPDFQCSFEMYTNSQFLELETLGPLVDLCPGSPISHVERWSLHKDVQMNSFTDAELDRVLLPLLSSESPRGGDPGVYAGEEPRPRTG
jgi:hypothetical protein